MARVAELLHQHDEFYGLDVHFVDERWMPTGAGDFSDLLTGEDPCAAADERLERAGIIRLSEWHHPTPKRWFAVVERRSTEPHLPGPGPRH